MNQAQARTVLPSDAPGGTRVSLAALVLANLLPLGLVAAGVWDVAEVVFFYWLENLVVGFYNLLRIATARQLAIGGKLGLGSFFTVHYGIFCMGHMVFLVDVFGFPGLQPGQPAPGGGFALFDVIAAPELLFPPRFWWPLLGLSVSHGFSFATHYALGGERLTANEGTLMGRPYGRIVAMHLWLFAGGFLIKHWNAPMAGLLALVLLKTAIDAGSHAYLHRSRRQAKARRRSR
jgi:hypothetical protein